MPKTHGLKGTKTEVLLLMKESVQKVMADAESQLASVNAELDERLKQAAKEYAAIAPADGSAPPKKKRRMSAAGRKRIAAAQKKRWAEKHKNKPAQ